MKFELHLNTTTEMKDTNALKQYFELGDEIEVRHKGQAIATWTSEGKRLLHPSCSSMSLLDRGLFQYLSDDIDQHIRWCQHLLSARNICPKNYSFVVYSGRDWRDKHRTPNLVYAALLYSKRDTLLMVHKQTQTTIARWDASGKLHRKEWPNKEGEELIISILDGHVNRTE